MLEMNNERFKGDFQKYKNYIIEVSAFIGDYLRKKGWVITTEVYDLYGDIRRGVDEVKYYDKKMIMTGTRNGEKVSVMVKKSIGDKHDDIFMHALGLYRLHDRIKNIKKEWKNEKFYFIHYY